MSQKEAEDSQRPNANPVCIGRILSVHNMNATVSRVIAPDAPLVVDERLVLARIADEDVRLIALIG
jgi:hypothetical protein